MEISLAAFDAAIVAQYTITEQDLQRVARYVQLLQGEDASTLADIAGGGYYGPSALLHEVVELRALLEREPELLQKTRFQVGQFLCQSRCPRPGTGGGVPISGRQDRERLR